MKSGGRYKRASVFDFPTGRETQKEWETVVSPSS